MTDYINRDVNTSERRITFKTVVTLTASLVLIAISLSNSSNAYANFKPGDGNLQEVPTSAQHPQKTSTSLQDTPNNNPDAQKANQNSNNITKPKENQTDSTTNGGLMDISKQQPNEETFVLAGIFFTVLAITITLIKIKRVKRLAISER